MMFFVEVCRDEFEHHQIATSCLGSVLCVLDSRYGTVENHCYTRQRPVELCVWFVRLHCGRTCFASSPCSYAQVSESTGGDHRLPRCRWQSVNFARNCLCSTYSVSFL